MRVRASRSSGSSGIGATLSSSLQTKILRIIERAIMAPGGRFLAESFHAEALVARDLDGQIAVDDGHADGVAEIGAAGDRDDLAMMQDCFPAEDSQRLFDGEDAELACNTLGLDFRQCGSPDEIAFLQRHP